MTVPFVNLKEKNMEFFKDVKFAKKPNKDGSTNLTFIFADDAQHRNFNAYIRRMTGAKRVSKKLVERVLHDAITALVEETKSGRRIK